MIDYPPIAYDYRLVQGRVCLVQEKLDGHNVRAEFNKGEFKLGSRRWLIGSDSDDAVFAAGAALFLAEYADPLAKALVAAKLGRAAVFGELYGSETHMKRVDYGVGMEWAFFDILDVSRKAFLEPREAMRILEGAVPVPAYGIETVDLNLVNAIRADETPGKEGVVIKPQRIRQPSLRLPYAKAKTKWFMGRFDDP